MSLKEPTRLPNDPDQRREPPGDRDDNELVRRAATGDTAAFEKLMRRHNALVYRAVRGILRNDADAEDAAQQAWCNAFLHIGSFEGRSKLTTWLARIAINEALATVRRHRGHASLDDEEGVVMSLRDKTAPDPEHRASLREAARVLERAIDELPPRYRVVFVLRETQGLSTAEVADVLELSEEAVKTRLSRGKSMLRTHIVDEIGRSVSEALAFDGARCDRLVQGVLARLGRGPR